MTLTRILRASGATLTHTFTVGETPTDASGPVVVSVKRLDGTTVASGEATHPGPAGQYAFTLGGQPLDALTVDWAATVGGLARAERDLLEVVGGFLFEVAEMRAAPYRLSPSAIPDGRLLAARVETEQECERICGQAFVPRFARVALDGDGGDTLLLPRIDLRAVRAVSVGGVPFTGEQLAKVEWSDAGVLYGWWPRGRRNVLIEFEYGSDVPPEPIRTAAKERCRALLGEPASGVPSRAASFTAENGGVYRLSMPTRELVGIPAVDGAYQKFALDVGGFA